MAADQVVRFDGWTLRLDSGELQRPGGLRARLQSQPLRVLQTLLERPGEMVARETLIARLWPRGVVEFDTALNSAVRRLRTVLGDHADAPRYIETVPKRGYRFIGMIEPAHLGDGTSTRAPTPQADVVPRVGPAPDAVSEFIGAGPTWPARRWHTHRRVGAALVAAAALIAWPGLRSADMATGPGGAARAATVAAGATEVLYRQGRFLLQRRGPGDVAHARQRFESVLMREPRDARAWAGIASSHWLDTVERRVPRAQGIALLRSAATRALAIDPGVAEAHLRLANAARLAGDRAAGDGHLARAVAAEPDDPLVLVFAGSAAADRGDWEDAIALQRRALEAEPLALAVAHNLAVYLYAAGRYDDAVVTLREQVSLYPEDEDAPSLLATALVMQGDPVAAMHLAEGFEDAGSRHFVSALAWHALGRREESDRELHALVREVEPAREHLVAEVHAFRGEADAAFERLAAVAAAPAGDCTSAGCWPRKWLANSPLLRRLEDDVRWPRWVAEVRVRSTG